MKAHLDCIIQVYIQWNSYSIKKPFIKDMNPGDSSYTMGGVLDFKSIFSLLLASNKQQWVRISSLRNRR